MKENSSTNCNSSLEYGHSNRPARLKLSERQGLSDRRVHPDPASDRHAPRAGEPGPSTASSSALLSSTWPFSLDDLPEAAYLVGGSVRDGLLARQTTHLDLDFVLAEGAVDTARSIAQRYGAGFVLLDAERAIARVVFPDATADFAQQMGDSLEDDLRRRDFTINAIAYSPHRNQFVDPLNGASDLKQNRLCMVNAQNLKDDPLRLLRAYRQAAQLGFYLDAETQQSIRELAQSICTVAPERVYAEISYLLNAPNAGTDQLIQSWRDGLLQPWLPDVSADSLAEVARIDGAARTLATANPAFGRSLDGWIRDQQQAAGVGRSWIKVAKLSCLTPNPARAESQLWRLKCSRAEVQAVLLLLELRGPLREAAADGALWAGLTRRQQYELFKQVGAAFPAVALVAIALGVCCDRVIEMMQRFVDADDPVAHPNPLLTGHDLMAELDLKPSRQMGYLLESLSLAHAESKIFDAQTAIAFAQAWLQDADKNQLM
ncbi:MAG: CCA tRNA nucleotidyltransferase [Elainellaceae cyanobacterium]